MAASNRLVVMCRTYGGKAAKFVCLLVAANVDPSGAAVVAIRAAIAALSGVLTTSASITQPGNYSTTSAEGAYEDDQDKASMVFKDSVGKYHSFRVPAPKADIFQDGSDQVDLGNAAVIAYANYVTTNFVSKTGATLVALVRGRRIRLKAGRRS